MKLTFLLPVSVTTPYISRVEWLRRSLDSLGTPYSEARIGLALSCDSEGCPEEKVRTFKEVDKNSSRYYFAAVNKARFNSFHYLETAAYRYRMLDDADVTIFCDADIFITGRFDELLEEVLQNESMAGVIARGSPFTQGVSEANRKALRQCNDEWWNHMFTTFVGRAAPLQYKYPAQSTLATPFYCNAGFLVASTKVWRTMAEFAYESLPKVISEIVHSSFRGNRLAIQYAFQITHSLALYRAGIGCRVLSPGFNAWNGGTFCTSTGLSRDDIRVIHYYGDPLMNFYKQTDFLNMIQQVKKVAPRDPVTLLLLERIASLG
jgi:hypothetical protein